MGWRKNKGKNGQKQGEKKPVADYRKSNRDNGKSNQNIVKENKNFEEFYLKQKIMPESELNDFLEAMKRPLPQTFRFAGFKTPSKLLIQRMNENFLDNFQDLEIDGEKISKPQPMPWYPNNLAWTTTISRQQLKRHPNLGEMHRFLISESEAGYVTRQEAVSMIPPLFMDIKSHHAVLDLCAAPGSKTSQIIELIHEDFENNYDPKINIGEKSVPSGFCIANDKNNKRCYMLVHQAKRLNSPSCIVTNHDATHFPGLVTKNEQNENIPLEFDRILCDVPCTGDGTMRKNMDIWKSWTPENSCTLNPTQVKILKRALELLKVGGKIIYSTCSLSPIEDEAVVGHVLSLCQGSAELVDCSDMLPNLKRRKGISKWDIMMKDGNWYSKHEDLPENKSHIMKQMFPGDDYEKYNLDRCMRFLPHDQDTGGFFVCSIQKTAKLPWESDRKKSVTLANKEQNEPSAKKPKIEKYRQGTFNEDPFYFYDNLPNHSGVKEMLSFYNLYHEKFPKSLLMSRANPDEVSNPKHFYLVSSSVKEVLQNNAKRLYLINSGVRLFCKTTIPNQYHPYRIGNDGLDVINRFFLDFPGRKIDDDSKYRCLGVSKEDMIVMLQSEYPFFGDYSDQLKKDHATLSGKIGCIICYLKEPINVTYGGISEQCNIQLTAWRGECTEKETLRAYIDKFDRRHYLHLLNAEVPEAIDLNKSKHRQTGTFDQDKVEETPKEE